MIPVPTEKTDLAHPDRKTIRSLFNSITDRYDFLNSFLSFGLERYWRKKLVSMCVKGFESSILDVGVGTGKSLAAFLNKHKFHLAVGCDFSENMLHRARKRFGEQAYFVSSDFHELPFERESFDIVTGSFILRSVQGIPEFLSEVKRVLKPDGQVVFLELTRPQNPWVWNLMYRPYVHYCVPLVGRMVSKHENAYQFLSQSIQAFMEPQKIMQELLKVGFRSASIKPLSLGTVTIIQGRV